MPFLLAGILFVLAASVARPQNGADCLWIFPGTDPPICWGATGSSEFVPPNASALVLNTEILTEDVGTIEVWADTSGEGNDQSQATAGRRPTTTGGLHSNGTWYGLVFDSTDDEYDLGGATLTGSYRAIAVSYELAAEGGSGAIFAHTAAVSGWPGLFRNVGALVYRSSDRATSVTIEATATTGCHWLVVIEDLSADTMDVWFDGALLHDDQALGGTTPQDAGVRVWRNEWQMLNLTLYRLMAWDSATALTWSAGDIAALDEHLECGS
jgi:hypothetical protein